MLKRDLEELANDFYDIVIVGGGIVGCGIANLASANKLKVALIEKNDFGSGTSSKSTEMIHGGLRYLQYGQFELTKKSCVHAGLVKTVAPHLTHLIPIVIPLYKNQKPKILETRIGLAMYTYFSQMYKKTPPIKFLSKKEILQLEPRLNKEGLDSGILFYEYGINAERLCLLNALKAVDQGAKIANHAKVVGFINNEGLIHGVKVKDVFTEKLFEIKGNLTVNASGPWVDNLCSLVSKSKKIRYTKGIHLLTEKFVDNGFLITAIDGRSIFVLPRQDYTLIGTTDDDYFGNLDNINPTEDEVGYLLDSVSHYFGINDLKILEIKSGIRPTVFKYGKNEDDLSREHEIYDHSKEGIKGLISIYGGKLATYGWMAEDLLKVIGKKLNVDVEFNLYRTCLKGGNINNLEEYIELEYNKNKEKLTKEQLSRLIKKYGIEYKRILEYLPYNASEGDIFKKEISYVKENEMACTPHDLERRICLCPQDKKKLILYC